MKRILILVFVAALLTLPVSAMDFSPPPAPDFAEPYMPESTTSFSNDLWYIIKQTVKQFAPQISHSAGICVTVIAIVIMISILENLSGASSRSVRLAGIIAISTVLISPSGSLIKLSIETVEALTEYGKLLLPVLTAALAAEGGTVTSSSLYTGTVLLNSVLTITITKLLIPMLYAFIALSVANAVFDEDVLKNLQSFVKWLISWTLKISIYLFTGYLGITRVISGSVDAAAVKAAKLAISGSIPVVGNIISDASETILVSTGIMKNATGTYGMLAILAIWIGPFIKVGVSYITIKLVAAVSGVFGCKPVVSLVENFGAVMSFLVAMSGTICLLHLISTVCFMKGVG